MGFRPLEDHLVPADGEVVVRSYHCTKTSPVFGLFGLKANAYLTVTNKRVVLLAEGVSLYGAAGSSRRCSELPIADVANLSLGKGTRFSILRLLWGCLFGGSAAWLATAGLRGVMWVLQIASGGGNPYLPRLAVFLQCAVASLLVLWSLTITRESIGRVMLAACATALVLSGPAFGMTHEGALRSMPYLYPVGMAILGISLAGYWQWSLYWFVRREYLAVAISSKSGLVTPIRILGVSWWGRINTAADLASGMAPAVDADIMCKELGALVIDIQTLGDHGVKKWLEGKRDDAAPRHKLADASCRRPVALYALAASLLCGAIVGGESILHSFAAKKDRASRLRGELAHARMLAECAGATRDLVPNLWVAAEREAIAGETAFGMRQYGDSARRWTEAIGIYTSMPGAVTALTNAIAEQSRYDALVAGTYIQESVSGRLKSGALIADFETLMNRRSGSNEYWNAVTLAVNRATLNAQQDRWGPAATAWDYAKDRLPSAIRLMHADLWIDLADDAIRNGDARSAHSYAASALNESPSHPRARQRMQLATNMLSYAQRFADELAKGDVGATSMDELMPRLDLYGGAEWVGIKRAVECARSSAKGGEWVTCNAKWEEALILQPAVILALQMERIEAQARRGNWSDVSRLAGHVLSAYPDNSRASELKDRADSIEVAYASEIAFLQALTNVLVREVASKHITMGDMSDFNAYMDRYGYEEWKRVKDASNRARHLRIEGRGEESSIEWKNACDQLPLAVRRVRAEIWLERAEQEVKTTNWSKVLVCAENALREKPDHVGARHLLAQADGIEETRAIRARYDQLFREAADSKIVDMGYNAGDQDALAASLARYAGGTWESVKNNIAKANELEARGQRVESLASWAAVVDALPTAIQKMRAEYWLAKAEEDAAEKLWGKVSIEAEKALVEDPESERARALKAEADRNSE